MILASAWAPASERAAALAAGYGVAFLVATVTLGIALGRRLGADRPQALGTVVRVVAAGAVALGVMAAVAGAIDATSRAAALATLAVAGAAGATAYAGALRLLTGTSLRQLVTIDDG
jgi:hypothetical protein